MSLWSLVLSLVMALLVVLVSIILKPTELETNGAKVLTDAKESLELAVEKANETNEANEANEKNILELLRVLSEELKTPLDSIVGYLGLISSGKLGEMTDKQKYALEVSLKKTTHMTTLITSMSDFAQMKTEELSIPLQEGKAGVLGFSFNENQLLKDKKKEDKKNNDKAEETDEELLKKESKELEQIPEESGQDGQKGQGRQEGQKKEKLKQEPELDNSVSEAGKENKN